MIIGMATLNRISKNPFVKAVEVVLYREKEIEKAVQCRRAEIASDVSGNDPTANSGIRLAQKIECVTLNGGDKVNRPEEWLEVFETVREYCQQDQYRLEYEIMKARYGRGRKRGEHQTASCMRLNISAGTYQRKLDSLRYLLVAEAASHGFIKIRRKNKNDD